MQRRELLMAVAHGERLRRLDKATGALGVFFNIHIVPSACCSAAGGGDQQKQAPALRPVAPPILIDARFGSRKPPKPSRIRRETQGQHLIGVPQAALTSINRPRSSPTLAPAC